MFNNKWIKYGGIIVLLLLLVMVRGYESIFYDPLQSYFKADYLHEKLPDLDYTKFLFNTFLRYLINAVISIAIIGLFFQRSDFVKFSIWFYTLGFVVLIVILVFSLRNHLENSYLLAFYTRRFLIQPLFLLLLLPAFHYQNTVLKR